MDRQCPNKDRGGGVMLIVPIKLNPKIREDLNHLNKTFFGSLWIECNMTTKNEFRKKQLINISYNPKKTLNHLFLEQLSQSIDSAITEKLVEPSQSKFILVLEIVNCSFIKHLFKKKKHNFIGVDRENLAM